MRWASSVSGWPRPAPPNPRRAPCRETSLQKAAQAGNYKDAYDGLRKLALDPKDDPRWVGEDLTLGVNCLQSLNRVAEIDEFTEAVVAVHKDDWRLLLTAAGTYQVIQHQGFIIAGKFERGIRRASGPAGVVPGRMRGPMLAGPSTDGLAGQRHGTRPGPGPAVDGPGDPLGPKGRPAAAGLAVLPYPLEHFSGRPRLQRVVAAAIPD